MGYLNMVPDNNKVGIEESYAKIRWDICIYLTRRVVGGRLVKTFQLLAMVLFIYILLY